MRAMLHSISLGAFLVSIATSVSLAGLDERTLRANPQWMPAQTTVIKAAQFQSGLKLAAGEKVDVVGFQDNGLILRKGTSKFMMNVPQTTLLKDADAYKAKFSEDQQKLTAKDLLTRKELWPYLVTMKNDVAFQDRTTFSAGKTYPLWTIEEDGLHVYYEKNGQTYAIDAGDTDFYEKALNGLIDPPSRLFDEVRVNAIHADTGKALEPTELAAPDAGGPKYLALYHAGAWCPHCETSTPDVVKWYDDLKAAAGDKPVEIELVLLSADKSPQEFKKHISEKKMNFLAIPMDRNKKAFVLAQLFPQRPTPWLYVVDRDGNTVVDGDADGSAKERTLTVIERINALLKAEPTTAPATEN
jgi:hypothetical protein